MKLLMLYADRFGYRTRTKNLPSEADYSEEKHVESAIVGLIHAEENDEQDESGVETKLIKNLKWAARKNDTTIIVLHSFSHLADSKASPDYTKRLLSRAELRLTNSGYQVYQTPFGYFLDLSLHAPGKSLARIFKSF